MVMNITEIEEVGLDNISNNHRTKNGIGICFFDPYDETLKEFDHTTRIPVYPLEKSLRKFYIVKDDFTITPNIVMVKVKANSDDYIVKSATDGVLDFDEIPRDNIVIDFFSKYPNGIIPFTLSIESLSTSLEEVSITIDLEAK